MKSNVFILFVAFFLVVLMSCKQEKENEPTPPPPPNESLLLGDDVEPEVLLYSKPLQEIQCSVIGKWRVAVSYGGVVGALYPVDHYITIDETT